MPNEIGAEVRDRLHPMHVAKVEAFHPKKGIYVRWHKGYASWLPSDRVVPAASIGWGTAVDAVGDPKREPPGTERSG